MSASDFPSQVRIRARNREIMREAKAVPCADCDERYPHYVMDFDHRDPSTKSFAIGGSQTRAETVLRAEIEKCDVVCANCHRERTHGVLGGDACPVVEATV